MKLVGGLAAACLGFAALAGQGGQAAASAPGEAQVKAADVVAQVEQRDKAVQEAASRSLPARTFLAQSQAPQATKAAEASTAKADTKTQTGSTTDTKTEAAAAPAAESLPAPVAGLDQTQMNNAKKIVDTAKSMGLGRRAQVIAVATAMQESTLYNLASTRLPESYNFPNDGEGSDHDSVGLFQQRPSAGWGSVPNLMKPEFATKQFLRALVQVPGWDSLPLTVAAQEVQVSAFPNHYAKHEARATLIVDALNK
ncbi:hypothetical protein [Allorhizocola rhizosphaerae]|uniref:hypothetical protein n=1 Tax=Allorhizocola rhizosphaerae TaxID=1872709 RepID=UPI001FE6DC6C|nr:hypothetical protein [Allorhizocola rhizosphaerae]